MSYKEVDGMPIRVSSTKDAPSSTGRVSKPTKPTCTTCESPLNTLTGRFKCVLVWPHLVARNIEMVLNFRGYMCSMLSV